MPTIKAIVINNMLKIAPIMMVVILFLSTFIQFSSCKEEGLEHAGQIFGQIEQILDENSKELVYVQDEYASACLSDARTAAYILEYNPAARDNIDELKKIAAGLQVDEIHIFNEDGVIIAGTHPEYYGYSFDSGEQMAFFKPMLTDKSLELVQDITPNTAESKLVQYSALWSEDGDFIVEIGMYPDNVLRATQKNELSYIFSLLGTGVGYELYAISPDSGEIVGSSYIADVGKNMSDIGFMRDQLKSAKPFYTHIYGVVSYCFSKTIEGNYIVWSTPAFDFYHSVITNTFTLLIGLLFIFIMLVFAVAKTMDRVAINPIHQINAKLRAIQDGDLTTDVDVNDLKEFSELSNHINLMVQGLLQSSEKLELSEKINAQNEELERQHEQLEAAVERAELASKAKSEFLFSISHDIRTPMNAILGFTQLAIGTSESDIQREYLQNIETSSHQLLDIIDSILELAKIGNHNIIIEEELKNIPNEYDKLFTVFENDLRNKNLTFNVSKDFKHTYMYVDISCVSQIFLNIVSNSIKYTPVGGTISVSFTEYEGDNPDTCVIETVIKDNGIGMSSEFLAQACDLFSQERTSTISGENGTGLGLAIVKNLVDLIHGTVDIESQQGEGTKVTIRLPHRIGSAPVEQDTVEEIDPELLIGKRILLAEDIDINAMITTKLLSSKGCLVERAKDGVECVNMLMKAENGYYDLILMDIQMPNMDGYRAAQMIREFDDPEKAKTPILALTANAFKEDCEKALESGMDGHIAKPIDASKMFQSIAEVL